MGMYDEYINSKLNEHLDFIQDLNYDVAYIALQGSQNYNLDCYTDEYQSDVDTKAIIIPSVDDIIDNKKPVSTTIILPDNSHCDVKDIRLMFDTFKKQNINFLEILFSKYYWINPEYISEIKLLRQHREDIAHYNPCQALRCMSGMSKEKLHALEHPYPNCIEEINKYGYSRKQLSHIVRVNDFIKKYVQGVSYEKCLIPDNIPMIMDLKINPRPLDEARRIAVQVDDKTYQIKEKYVNELETLINEGAEYQYSIIAQKVLEEVKRNIMKKKFRKNLLGEM